jgi:hypothetical protein
VGLTWGGGRGRAVQVLRLERGESDIHT